VSVLRDKQQSHDAHVSPEPVAHGIQNHRDDAVAAMNDLQLDLKD
jgi:hypothetical protein